jgi:predicted PP-loop superfamily ATPase
MGNLDFDQYVEDVEIKNLMQSLKSRVDNLKQEPDWREKWKLRLKEKTEKRKQEYLKEKEQRKQDEDNMSVIASTGGDSKASFLFGGEALTVSSSKTQGKIKIPNFLESINGLKQQLEDKKKGKSNWNKTVSLFA